MPSTALLRGPASGLRPTSSRPATLTRIRVVHALPLAREALPTPSPDPPARRPDAPAPPSRAFSANSILAVPPGVAIPVHSARLPGGGPSTSVPLVLTRSPSSDNALASLAASDVTLAEGVTAEVVVVAVAIAAAQAPRPSLLALLQLFFAPPPAAEPWEKDYGECTAVKARHHIGKHSHIADRLSDCGH